MPLSVLPANILTVGVGSSLVAVLAEIYAAQPDLFTDYEALEKQKAEEQAELDKEKRLQQAIIGIKNRMGKNAILKGTNFVEGATGKERNEQIGGHRK